MSDLDRLELFLEKLDSHIEIVREIQIKKIIAYLNHLESIRDMAKLTVLTDKIKWDIVEENDKDE